MPSPLSGLTQAAASPTSSQFGPATPLTAPPIGSRAEDGSRTSSPERERLALAVGVVAHQRLEGDVRGPLRRGERADADVHAPAAEREDPAVAGQQLAPLAAELEVAGDPVVVAPGLGVAAGRHPVRGLAVPGPAQHPPERGAHAVGDDQPAAGDLDPALRRCRRAPPSPARRAGRRPRRGPRGASGRRTRRRRGGSGRRARSAARPSRGRAGGRRARAARGPGRSRGPAGPGS